MVRTSLTPANPEYSSPGSKIFAPNLFFTYSGFQPLRLHFICYKHPCFQSQPSLLLLEACSQPFKVSLHSSIPNYQFPQRVSHFSSSRTGQMVTALLRAAFWADVDTVRLLIEKDAADINAADDTSPRGQTRGQTALMMLAQRGLVDTVRFLIEKGADIHAADEEGRTALMLSAEKGHVDTVRLLIEKGADDIHATDEGGQTALMLAIDWRTGIHTNTVDTVRLLIEKGADVNGAAEGSLLMSGRRRTALMMAAQQGLVDIVRLLIEKGADIHAADEEGRTALMMAAMYFDLDDIAQRGNVDTVRLLIEKGADIHATDDRGQTAMMLAVERSSGIHIHTNTVRLLIEKGGADVNATDDRGRTALMMSAQRGLVDISRLLIEKGAEVNAADEEGRTAMMLAVERSSGMNIDTVRLLIEKGADVNAADEEGQTALTLAAEYGQVDIVHLLEQREAAALVIQKRWLECFYNPKYRVCRNRIREEFEEFDNARLQCNKPTGI